MIKKDILLNSLIFLFAFSIDRFTKHLALAGFFNKFACPFLSFDVLINRGISCGLLHSENDYYFFAVSFFVSIVVILLLFHIKCKIKTGDSVFFETLILSGAMSNFIDRILHNGVIDFIYFSFGKFPWPGVFNLADVFIVFGTLIILIKNFQ